MSGKKKTTRAAAAKSRSKTKSTKSKKDVWFVATRWSYLPVSPQGKALYIPYVLLLVLILVVAADQDTVAEGITIALPGLIAITAAMQWFAAHKS